MNTNIAVLSVMLMLCILPGSASTEGTSMSGRESQAKLTIELRPTYGARGALRPAQFLPGENASVLIVIANLAHTSEWDTDYSVTIELFDAEGMRLLEDRQEFSTRLAFGNDSIPFTITIKIPSQSPAPKCFLRVSVDDAIGKVKATQELALKVAAPGTLGAQDIRFARDVEGTRPASAVGSVGDGMCLLCSLTGCAVKGGRLRVGVRFTILDEEKKPLRRQEEVRAIDELAPSDNALLRVHYEFLLTRPGRFFLRMNVEDAFAGKQVSYDIPFAVYPVP